MQDIDDYERHIHTAGQAAMKMKKCCTIFGYRFGYRLLSTFNGALMVVIGFLASNLIIEGIDEGIFSFTKFAFVMMFILVTIISQYTQEQFIAEYSDRMGVTRSDLGMTTSGWAHANWQG